jgi:hypothetical protein
MRGGTMQGLKHAAGFLVGRESLEANSAPLNDKPGGDAREREPIERGRARLEALVRAYSTSIPARCLNLGPVRPA